jgi:hypothetical protein
MPAYGNMLAAFPELMREYEVFKMEPQLGAGYGKRYDKRTATGYMSWRRGDDQSVVGGAHAHEDLGTFWEQHDFKTGERVVAHNDFVEIKGTIYRLLEDADFGLEAGFSKWKVKSVFAVTDQQRTNRRVDKNILDDYA